MYYYERDVTGGTVKWQPENEQLAYEAIAQCSTTTPGTVSEAESQCPIEIKDGEHAEIQSNYSNLLKTSKTNG
jgi:hypothetical protein